MQKLDTLRERGKVLEDEIRAIYREIGLMQTDRLNAVLAIIALLTFFNLTLDVRDHIGPILPKRQDEDESAAQVRGAVRRTSALSPS